MNKFKIKHFLLLMVLSQILFTTSFTNCNNDSFLKELKEHPSFEMEKYSLYYIEYQNNHNLIYTLNKVNYPNFYENSITSPAFYFSDKTGNSFPFVNKTYYLSKDFIPDNLVLVDLPKINRVNQQMLIEQNTLENYHKLYEELVNQGLELVIFSAYRSYNYQIGIFQNAKNKSYVALPGHSEHQTGFALDVSRLDIGLTEYFENTYEFEYLINNAHKYGFILRYPKGKENITGYSYEPWHFRFVGKEIATFIYNNNLTLEEYIYQYVELN